MNWVRSLKYLTPYVVYLLSWVSFHNTGWWVWLPICYAFVLIPLLELFLRPDPGNLDKTAEELARNNLAYDVMVYLPVVLQYFSLWNFLHAVNEPGISFANQWGRVMTMGLLCGSFGINVGHELGHRTNRFEQFLAKCLLLTSLYMHFFIEHNKGHHRHVATPQDPSTAKFRQSVYVFWIQSVFGTYRSAWQIAIADAKKAGNRFPVWNNEMMGLQCVQLIFISGIAALFGIVATLYFVTAAIMGALLLETVNYIEHYGLARKKAADAHYERVKPQHSWNSNHVIGRLMLFELSRHSDHHYLASRKYQILRHMENAPQMPTGYPGMILLSLFPPLWFHVMHRQMQRYGLLQEQAQ